MLAMTHDLLRHSMLQFYSSNVPRWITSGQKTRYGKIRSPTSAPTPESRPKTGCGPVNKGASPQQQEGCRRSSQCCFRHGIRPEQATEQRSSVWLWPPPPPAPVIIGAIVYEWRPVTLGQWPGPGRQRCRRHQHRRKRLHVQRQWWRCQWGRIKRRGRHREDAEEQVANTEEFGAKVTTSAIVLGKLCTRK